MDVKLNPLGAVVRDILELDNEGDLGRDLWIVVDELVLAQIVETEGDHCVTAGTILLFQDCF